MGRSLRICDYCDEKVKKAPKHLYNYINSRISCKGEFKYFTLDEILAFQYQLTKFVSIIQLYANI